MLRLGLMEISSGFLLLMALLFYFDQNGVIWLALLACFLHECGHWAIIHLCGGKVCRIHVRAVGAEMVLDPAHCLSYRREWLCTIAGPATNLLLAAAGAWAGASLWAGLNFILGCFHLLPVLPLDGGRCCYLLGCMVTEEERARRLMQIVSLILSVLFTIVGAYLFFSTGGNPTLLIVGGWIFSAFGKQKDLSTLV